MQLLQKLEIQNFRCFRKKETFSFSEGTYFLYVSRRLLKIADLVRQSHEARKKSKELLEEAKRKVEEMIERETHG